MVEIKVNDHWVKTDLTHKFDSQIIDGIIFEIPFNFLITKCKNREPLELRIEGQKSQGLLRNTTKFHSEIFVNIFLKPN